MLQTLRLHGGSSRVVNCMRFKLGSLNAAVVWCLLMNDVLRQARQRGGIALNFSLAVFTKIVVFCGPETRGRFLAPKPGPISGQGCQPGDFRLAVGGGLCGGEAEAAKWTAISGSFFFKKNEVAGLILGCRFGLRVLVDSETELSRKPLVGVMSL